LFEKAEREKTKTKKRDNTKNAKVFFLLLFKSYFLETIFFGGGRDQSRGKNKLKFYLEICIFTDPAYFWGKRYQKCSAFKAATFYCIIQKISSVQPDWAIFRPLV
jgi:hypothetical protein